MTARIPGRDLALGWEAGISPSVGVRDFGWRGVAVLAAFCVSCVGTVQQNGTRPPDRDGTAPPPAVDGGTVPPESDGGTVPATDAGVVPVADAGAPPATDAGSPEVDAGLDAGPPRIDAGPPPVTGTPRDSATVYWVGHSLISHRDRNHGSSETLFELLGTFARAGGQSYDFHRHTTPGAPLSWNWNNEGAQRAEIEHRGGRYDVMVMTEGVDIRQTIRWHDSAFYARRFQCAMQNANPGADVYLYESWHHLYASDPDMPYPDPHVWDWHQRLLDDRAQWESIIDDAFDGPAAPSSYYRGAAGECTPSRRMFIVPVGTALAALHERLESPLPGENWEGITPHTLLQNGYRDWPAEWPVPPPGAGVDWRSRIAGLRRYYGYELDDIHPGQQMVYFISLVHYATVYRRNPVGLPATNGVSARVARQMQELVWDVVSRDPRAGVRRD